MFAKKMFSKEDFLLVYRGDLMSDAEGQKREESYNPDVDGNFIFFFIDECKGKRRRWR